MILNKIITRQKYFSHKFIIFKDSEWIHKLDLHKNGVVLPVEELLWILFNFPKDSRSWECDSLLACKDILLRNPEVYCRVHNRQTLYPIPGQLHTFHRSHPIYVRFILMSSPIYVLVFKRISCIHHFLSNPVYISYLPYAWYMNYELHNLWFDGRGWKYFLSCAYLVLQSF
jgi:hypothetical protein